MEVLFGAICSLILAYMVSKLERIEKSVIDFEKKLAVFEARISERKGDESLYEP